MHGTNRGRHTFECKVIGWMLKLQCKPFEGRGTKFECMISEVGALRVCATFRFTPHRGLVGKVSDFHARGRGFDSRSGQATQ